MAGKIRIRLKAFDHVVLDQAAADIVRTAKRYDALVLVDEAHSFGFYGPRGAGLCAAQGVSEQVDFIMTTMSNPHYGKEIYSKYQTHFDMTRQTYQVRK